MNFDVDKNTIFLAVTGSHAYGMARPESDVDIRGAAIRPRRIRESFYQRFEQFMSAKQVGPWGEKSEVALEKMAKHPTAQGCYEQDGEIDLVIYDLAKIFQLATDANPNILELLFLDDRDILYQQKSWEILRENRDLFLSKKVKHTYTGYAMSQLKRIKGHRSWLMNPPTKKPSREDFGLPEKPLLPSNVNNLLEENAKKTIREWQVQEGLEDHIKGATQDAIRTRIKEFQAAVLRCDPDSLNDKLYDLAAINLGVEKNVVVAHRAERKYRSAMKTWQQYMSWKTNRNEKRAELESRFGYDTKHASHLIRLLRTGLEILRDGKLSVNRVDAQDLSDIRNGAYSYDEIMTETEHLKVEIEKFFKITTLPSKAPMSDLDEIFLKVIGQHDKGCQ